MQESLSNFTPLAWEKSHASRMAFFQRLAGVPEDEILRGQKANMAHEVDKAHARMQPRSPVTPQKSGGKRRLQSAASPSRKKDRMKQAAALTSSPPKERLLKRPEAVLRSPRTNRRIYALETQLPGGGGVAMGQRATSLQPLYREVASVAVDQRRAVSEATFAAAEASSSRQAGIANGESTRPVEDEEPEEESETLPLPWPTEDDTEKVQAKVEDQADATQPLAWDDPEDEPQEPRASEQPPAELVEVPPSDDEDLLLQNVFPSSSSSSSPSSSPSPSPSRFKSATRGATPPPLKRQRTKQEQPDASPLSNRLMRTPLQAPPPLMQAGLPRVSPVSLTPTTAGAGGAGGSSRFDRVVAALKREERRQHGGAQLHLDSFISSRSRSKPEATGRREGLSDDLQDVLSDDDDEEADITVNAEQQADEEADETQPLPWSSPQREQSRTERPYISPLVCTQRSTASSASTPTNSRSATGSSSAVSLPSETNLDDAGNTQLRSFFQAL